MDKTTFAPYVNTEFRVSAPGADAQTLRLVEVSDLERDAAKAENPRRGRRGFSLLFTGTRESLLEQRDYAVSHSGLGDFQLFLVPVMPEDDEHYFYEAIFNRL